MTHNLGQFHGIWRFDSFRRRDPLLLTELSYNSVRIKACISNYIDVNQWYVINQPFPSFDGGLIKPPLKRN